MKKTNAAAAAAAGALVTAGLAVSWRDGHRFVVRNYQISSPKIRENTRIVFLSDLHSQVYGKKKDPDGPNGPLLRAIRSLNPDAVMIGGDMIVAKDAAYDKPGWKEVPLDLIEKLAKEFPVYFAEGNHEAQLASKRLEGRYLRQYLEYHEEAERLGAIRVHNRSVVLRGGIRLYGLDLDSETFRKFLPYHLCKEQVEENLGEPDPDKFCLVLAHNPKFFPVYADWGADLVLSGHIHGGIIRLGPKGPGLLSPDWHFFPDYTGGEYRIRREDGTEAVMVLSCGTGTHSLHLRFMNPGEVSLLELSRC